jgi:CelD/BcsL family acetyltransferase involved in cellulose biosynthesis
LPWTRRLWGGGKIRTIAIRRGDRLAALLPLFFWGYGGKPETIRASFLGAGVTDYTDLLVEPGMENECAAAALGALCELRERWDICGLEELRPDSPLLAVALPRGVERQVEPCSRCPVAQLGSTIDEHMAGLDAKFRTDLRRAENRLHAQGNVEFVSGIALMDDLFRLHSARWEQRNEAGMLAAAQLQAFHRESAAALAPAGMLRIYGLMLDEGCIAVQYNLAAKGRAYAYLSGFDPAWGKFSPGGVLLKRSIAEAIGEGIRTFDFLRKAEPFKYLWGAEDIVNSRLTIRRTAALEGLATEGQAEASCPA